MSSTVMDTGRPLVSIVMATYGRPSVLRYAIESVREQTLTDWELLVVGDACTDDTEDVVAGFSDTRIRFINLARNFGEQAGPNNVGTARARGRYLGYLNHDDLWFPEHLQSSLDWLEATGADLVFPLCAVIAQASPEDLAAHRWSVTLTGFGRAGRYDPVTTFAPASTWLMRTEAASSVGPWRPARECISASSQDFLFRAWRSGLFLGALPWISVLAFHSGTRKGSYRTDTSHEQAWFLDRLRGDPGFLSQVLARVDNPNGTPVGPWRRQVMHTLAHLGISPTTLGYLARGFRRGQFIQFLRRERGLPALPPADFNLDDQRHRTAAGAPWPGDAELGFQAAGQGVRYQLSGWSYPEDWGTWTIGAEARLLFAAAPRPDQTPELCLVGRFLAFVHEGWPRQRVVVSANSRQIGEWVFTLTENLGTRMLRIPPEAWVSGTPLTLSFRTPDARSPAELGISEDGRRLGMGVIEIRLCGCPPGREARPDGGLGSAGEAEYPAD